MYASSEIVPPADQARQIVNEYPLLPGDGDFIGATIDQQAVLDHSQSPQDGEHCGAAGGGSQGREGKPGLLRGAWRAARAFEAVRREHGVSAGWSAGPPDGGQTGDEGND